MAGWFRKDGDAVLLKINAQPGSKLSEVAGLHGEALKIRLAAPPVEGKANEALLRFIAEQFEVPLRNVELLRGAQSRHKMVKVSGSRVLPESLVDGSKT